jgi:alkylation response protein AidB-like acyl-CoA dehydrogenase
VIVDFELDAEQAMLRAAARDLLADHTSARAAAMRTGDVDPAFWRLAVESGWPGLGLPEECGGAGQGLVELALVAEEVGRAAAAGPYLPTVLVGRALTRADGMGAVLAALAAGDAWATWAFAEPDMPWSLDGIAATARTDGDSVVLDGVKIAVQDADGAGWLLVTARHDGVPTSFLVDRHSAGITVRRCEVLDLTRGFHEVRLDGVRVAADRRLPGGADAMRRLLDDAAVLLAAETLGVLDRMLEMTTEYMKVRVQFDRPLGTFQAVKHACADMALLVHGVRAATWYAAMAVDADARDAERAACVAASYSSAAAGDVAGTALQLHGGIGFTWEHDLHLYLRRATVDGMLYGDATSHRDRLCGLLGKPANEEGAGGDQG